MKHFFLSIFSVVCFSLLAADAPRSPRVDFSSDPVGVKVIVNKTLRGVTPLSLYDLTPGKCHVRFECNNYELKDEFFEIGEGAYLSKHVELEPINGLLLLTTEPAGCSIFLDGLSLGETPRLITTLKAKDSYRLKLEKPGYQTQNVDIKFSGRTPLVKHEKLMLNSGILEIVTEPSGASVLVNGISRGQTPLNVSDIPKGSAKVEIKLDGYKDVVRELQLNAGDSQKLDITLEGLPGSLTLTSVPDGARFYLNGSIRGKGPINIPELKPGTYKVRAELSGYGTVERNVTIANGKKAVEEFRLESNLGRIEIRTQPIGVSVIVDGRNCGTTKATTKGSAVSDVLTIPQLTAGEHTVVLKCHGYGEVVKRPTIESKKATVLDVKLKAVFTPNVRIQTLTGTHTGVLVNNGAETIVIETSPGVTRSFPKLDLRKIEFLTEGK